MKKFLCSADAPIVETKQGKLRGFQWGDLYHFRGVKYAESARFMPPHDPTPWEGVREAQIYGYVCSTIDPYGMDGNLIVPHRYWHQSEHCQNLNIWTPSLDKNAKKPVIVWIHGGGYTNGSALEHVDYDGENLARFGDMVVITINHRLNIIGYFDLSSFDEKYANSVNAGNADLVAALKWIHENIEGFGGDPENVTIFGQSGGGGKVSNLLQTPAAAGLFHKAIIQSGIGDFSRRNPMDGRKVALAMLEELGLTEKDYDVLAEIPYEKLAATFKAVSPKLAAEGVGLGWGPKANDWYVGDMRQVGICEHAKSIPVIIGSVFAEFTDGFDPQPELLTEAEHMKIVEDEFGEHAQEVLDAFVKAYPEKPLCYAAYADRIFRSPSLGYARCWAAQSDAPIYCYMMSYTFPYMGAYPTWHCAELPLVFHNTDLIEVYGNEDCKKLEKEMAGAWVAFAHTGNPNHADLIEWPAFTGEHPITAVFDKETTVREGYDDELMKLLDLYKPAFAFGLERKKKHKNPHPY